MNSREKIKDAYEKLQCFDNPVLQEIAEKIKESYIDIFGQGIDGIITDVALQQGVNPEDISSTKRDEKLVYCRYLVAQQAISDYTLKEIAKALNRNNHTTIIHYLKDYTPPNKFT